MGTPDKPGFGMADIFIPYAEQQTPVKMHAIRLTVPAYAGDPESEIPHELQGKLMPCCDTIIRPVVTTHRFHWGNNPTLLFVVPDVTLCSCDCGINSIANGQQAPILVSMANKMRLLRDFPSLERLRVVQALLPEMDVRKVVDFMDSMSQEPHFLYREKYLQGIEEVKRFI